MRLIIYSTLLLITFAGAVALQGDSTQLFQRLYNALFSDFSFLIVVGITTMLAIMMYSERFMRLFPDLSDVLKKNGKEYGDDEAKQILSLMEFISANALSVGGLFVLFSLISAVYMAEEYSKEWFLDKIQNFSGLTEALILSIFFVFVSSRFKRMIKSEKSEHNPLLIGEYFALFFAMLFTGIYAYLIIRSRGV